MNNIALLVPLLLASGAAAAEGGQAFVRAEVGRSHQSASIQGFGQSISDNDNTYSLRGGYFFNPHFAVEAFYSDLYNKSNGFDQGTASLRGKAAGIGVIGKHNFGGDQQGWFVDGRTGAEWGKIDAQAGSLNDNSLNSVKPYFGLGGGYDFNPNMGVSLNWDWHKTADQGVSVTSDTLTAGFEYRF